MGLLCGYGVRAGQRVFAFDLGASHENEGVVLTV